MSRRSDDDDAHERAAYERELAHAERIKSIRPSPLVRAPPLDTRVSRLVDLMLATARIGEELLVLADASGISSECEDTEHWARTEQGVEAWTERVYPAMARIRVNRHQLTLVQARAELIDVLDRHGDLDGLEARWRGVAR